MTKPAAKSESFGRSYWDIVVVKFRKNWAARGALWLVIVLVLTAIYAPIFSNDRPFAFYGTMKGEYVRSYRALIGPAHANLLKRPKEMADEIEAFRSGTAKRSQMEKQATPDELRPLIESILRLDGKMANHPKRGIWRAKEMTLNGLRELKSEGVPILSGEERAAWDKSLQTVRARLLEIQARDAVEELDRFAARVRDMKRGVGEPVLTPEDLALWEQTFAVVGARLPSVYAARLGNDLSGIELKLDEMAAQVPSLASSAEELKRKYRVLASGDYLSRPVDREAFAPLLTEVKTSFDPEKVQLAPRWFFPLFDDLDAVDVGLLAAATAWLIAFVPLHWLWFRRVEPRARRWRHQWTIVAAAAALSAGGWAFLHPTTFKTTDYLREKDTGDVTMQKAFWPLHRFRPNTIRMEEKEQAPSGGHPLGTDHMGRDLLARVLWGSRVSLSVGFFSTGIALSIGIVLGALSGYFMGWVDGIISRIIEVFLCFPYFFVILAVVAFLPPNIYYVMLAIGFFSWMSIARLTRGEFLRLRKQDFVTAAIALGAKPRRVIFRHVLPNALAPVLISASFGIASAILAESALSFLGVGVIEPQTSWGSILSAARTQIKQWWTVLFPGLCIFISITCYNLVGDGIRDAVDPRLKID